MLPCRKAVSIVAPCGSSGASLLWSVLLFLVQYVMHLVLVAVTPPRTVLLSALSLSLSDHVLNRAGCTVLLVTPFCALPWWIRACVCSVVVVKFNPRGAWSCQGQVSTFLNQAFFHRFQIGSDVTFNWSEQVLFWGYIFSRAFQLNRQNASRENTLGMRS